MKRLALIVAAGTGGHLYPGIAMARSILKQGQQMANDPGWDVIFAVRQGDMGKMLLEREGFQVVEFSGQGWPRRISLKTFAFPFKVVAGFCQAWSFLDKRNPRIVAGMGGYLSFGVLVAARLKGIPTLIHEQNVLPGLTNRILGRFVKSVAVSFPESEKYFSNKGVWVSGLPVRAEIGRVSRAEGRKHFGLTEHRTTLLVFGGSLGASRLNQVASQSWPLLNDLSDQFQVLHIAGERDYACIEAGYKTLPVKAAVLPYCHDMAAAYGAADLVICRAGASTVAELLVAQRPAILVPYPYASEDHQIYNAEVLVQRALAQVILEKDLTPEVLAKRLRPYLEQVERLEELKQRYAMLALDSTHILAAEHLADYITAIP